MKTTPSSRALAVRPLSVVAALLAVATVGNAMLAGCGGKSNETSSTTTPSTATTPTPAPDTSAGSMAVGGDEGAKIYAEKCSVCHGPNGKGDGPGGAALNPKPRDHTNGAYMNARTDDQLLEVIRNGKGNMPAWKSVLTDEQIHAVLKHVRSLAVPPYTS